MRILHTSDWHIGRQFHNVSLLEDQRHVLNQVIDIIRDRQVDVLLIAGDIYDRSVPAADAVTLLDEVIHGPHRFFNRRVLIGPVAEEKIQVINLEPLQSCITGFENMCRGPRSWT